MEAYALTVTVIPALCAAAHNAGYAQYLVMCSK
jgi:hypothetical protein